MPEYISLKTASEISGYSPDYLGLLIRQGKMKGVKIGRNWCTTEEFVLEYKKSINKKSISHSMFWFGLVGSIASIAIVIVGILVFFAKSFDNRSIWTDTVSSPNEALAYTELSDVEITAYILGESGEIGFSVKKIER